MSLSAGAGGAGARGVGARGTGATADPIDATARLGDDVETSAAAAAGAAIWRNTSSLAVSSSISTAKFFFIHAARSLRE